MLPLAFCLAAAPNPKHDATNHLHAAERARAEKLAALAAAQKQAQLAASRQAALAQQRIDTAAKLRATELKVADAVAELQDAETEKSQAEAAVQQRTNELSAMLPLALRLSLYPTETLLAVPAPPEQALEGLLATHGLSAELARQVAALRAEQAHAEKIRKAVTRWQTALSAERSHQTQQAAALDQQIDQARQAQANAQDAATEAAEAAAVLAARAGDLRSAIAAMDEAEQKQAAEAARAARLHQAKPAPVREAGPGLSPTAGKTTIVAGHVARAFGAPAEDGPATGITYSTAPAAYVASPCTGRVAFAAPFRSYGRLIIIECGGGYDFVLAGLDRLDAQVGRNVRPGEPVGRMPDSGRPGLYVELRRNGQTIDPQPFLNGKA